MSQEGFGDLFSRKRAAQAGVGFAVALAIIYLLAVGVGLDRLIEVLTRAELRWVAAGALSTALCLVAWARVWQIVLRVVGFDVSFRKLVVTFYAATFANYVTPLGQAGGEPFIAYVLSRDTEASYEDSLASVVTADLLNLFPFFSFAGIGFAALLYTASLPTQVRPLALGLGAMAVGVPVFALVGWRFRFWLGNAVLRLAAPITRRVRFLSLASLRGRMRDLNTAFERIADDPWALVHALLYAYVGWIFFALPLYFAGLAIEAELTLLLVFFIVPASTLAGLVPSPGGLGGVETALLVLLVGLAGLGQAPALAATLLYRVESYVFGLVAGGVAALWVVFRN
ncbi:lysylphosphatidylglycerol synthase transmembrane domain-containing protein [Salinibaculum rarum]|uniref:lysylphosphatidylglycerol synthase transmembrane domain-containing protein n=1 Tax=Salinibaculum rarum TaxID=3058903 RepID=UPI00265FEAAB|nr:lysylphosphatidylglycerol synthase transmembrane domain-containing protein [Salinibaculum sp. KK48]